MIVFLEHLEAACARGEMEVHAFSLMTTHYHLLVRSPRGELADGMQRVQTEYSRWFNRSRRRDGPLVRGRYAAKKVRSHAYRCAVIRYIDRNPVSAGIVQRAGDYPYGSARAYEGSCPEETSWLERGWIENEVCQALSLSAYDPTRYAEVFGRLPDALARVIEARWRSPLREDPLDDLIAAAPAVVVDWMKRKAELADGVRPGLPIVALDTLEGAIRALSSNGEEWTLGRRSGWTVLEVGLARQLCGLRLEEIGEHVGLSRSATGNLARLHVRLLREDEQYARRASSIARRALHVWKCGGK